MEIPTPEQAERSAESKLNDNYADAERELIRDIDRQHPGKMCVMIRGGDYTDRVRELITERAIASGWKFEQFDGYWLTFNNGRSQHGNV